MLLDTNEAFLNPLCRRPPFRCCADRPSPTYPFPLPLLSRSQSASPHHYEIQVLSDLAVQISHFFTIFKRSVNHPQPSVATVIALEPATLAGDSKAHQQLHNEAGAPGHKQNVSHVSHGQL
ncbi:hypothetical protein HN51_029227 [Arachis hypogaea]